MEIGHYRVERQLADGPNKKLYEAVDRHSGQRVIVRSLPVTADTALLARLQAQAGALTSLGELGGVACSDWGSDFQGCLYLVTPFIAGQSLAVRLAQPPGRPLPEAMQLGLLLSRLLAKAHAMGIAHLELRPSQVLLLPSDASSTAVPDGASGVRLLGLGIRQVLGSYEAANDRPPAETIQRTFLAPEQQEGLHRGELGGPSADVFALGVLLWNALTGSNPFIAGTSASGVSVLRPQDATLPGLGAVHAQVPRELPLLLVRMLSVIPQSRPSMEEVARFFEAHRGRVPPLPASADEELPAIAGNSMQIQVPALDESGGASTDPMTGALFGNFRVIKKLGEGGMGVVYEARHRNIGRRAAVKVMHPSFAQNAEFAARFLNEARAVNIISHPGLVEIFEYGRLNDGTLFIVMEFLEGETLKQRMQNSSRPFPEEQVLHIGGQLARALAVAHEKGIIHRDLKPENIMVVPDPISQKEDWVKILDFGIAKVDKSARSNRADENNRTRPGETIGTPRYMAPEQYGSADSVDGRADVFSLGVVLYELLTGKAPYEEMSLSLYKKKPPPIREICQAVSEVLEALILRMLEPQTEARPMMAEVAQTLTQHRATYSLAASQTGVSGTATQAKGAAPVPAEEARTAARARTARFYAAFGLAAVVAALCMLAWRFLAPARPPEESAESLALSVIGEGLKSQDGSLRLRALNALAMSGEPRHRLILEPLLRSDNAQLAAAAAHALGQLGAFDAQPALLELIGRRPDPIVVVMAADALCRLKHPEGIRILVEMLEHGNPEIRIKAATSLLEQGNLAGAAMLWERVSRGTLSDMAALVTLGQLAMAGEERAQKMLEMTLPRLSGQARLFAAFNLGRLGNEEARGLLLNAAAQAGTDQLLAAQLAAALGEPRGYERLLGAAASDKDPDAIRELAVAGLADCNRQDAIPALSRILVQGRAGAALRLGAAGAILRLAAGEQSRLAQQSLNWAMAALGSDSAVTRELATAALGEMNTDESITPLSKALRDQQREVRRGAARALGRKSARAALDALSGALDDQDLDVRAAGLRAIQRVIGSLHKKGDREADKQILSRLQRLTKEGSPADRVVASGILLQLGDNKYQSQLLDALLSREGLVRKLAVEYADADEVLLSRALRDTDRGVRFAAARRLADSGSHLGAAVLREVAQGGEVEGLIAYIKLKALGEAAEPPVGLTQLLHSTELQTRLDVMDAVADLPEDRALSLLYIASRDPAAAIRRRCIEVAGEFYKRTGIGTYLGLIRNLLRDPEPLVRGGASEFLFAIKSQPAVSAQQRELANTSKPIMPKEPEAAIAMAQAEGSSAVGADGQVRFVGEESVRIQIDDLAPQAISSRPVTLAPGTHRISYLGGEKEIKIESGTVLSVTIPTTYAEQLLHDGIDAYQSKHYERAREHLERLRVLEGRGRVKRNIGPDIAYNLGRIYEARKDTARAMQEYGRLLAMPEARKRPELLAPAERAMTKLESTVGHFVVFRSDISGKCEKSDLYLPPGKHLIDVGLGKSEVVRSQAGVTQTLNKCQ